MVTWWSWWSPKATFQKHRKFRSRKIPTEAQWFLDFCKIHKAETPTLGPSSRPDRSERPERFGVDLEEFIAKHGAMEAERLRMPKGEWDVGWSWGNFGQRFGSFGWKKTMKMLEILNWPCFFKHLSWRFDVQQRSFAKKTTDMGTLNWRIPKLGCTSSVQPGILPVGKLPSTGTGP